MGFNPCRWEAPALPQASVTNRCPAPRFTSCGDHTPPRQVRVRVVCGSCVKCEQSNWAGCLWIVNNQILQVVCGLQNNQFCRLYVDCEQSYCRLYVSCEQPVLSPLVVASLQTQPGTWMCVSAALDLLSRHAEHTRRQSLHQCGPLASVIPSQCPRTRETPRTCPTEAVRLDARARLTASTLPPACPTQLRHPEGVRQLRTVAAMDAWRHRHHQQQQLVSGYTCKYSGST